jgi:hypothetical protein
MPTAAPKRGILVDAKENDLRSRVQVPIDPANEKLSTTSKSTPSHSFLSSSTHRASQSTSSSSLSSSSLASQLPTRSASLRDGTNTERSREEFEDNESNKRLRLINTAFDFGKAPGYYDNDESCQRTARETISSFLDVMGEDSSTKAMAEQDAKILLMRFPSIAGATAADVQEELFHPLFMKLSQSSNAGNREIAGALSAIMVQQEISRVKNLTPYACRILPLFL